MALAVKKRFMPATNRNYPGPELNDSGDLYILVHETGNTAPGATAEMHANFVYNGGGSSSVSFHLTVDQVEAWQMMKLNIIGWHASDGCDSRALDWGCFRSVAIETCVNSNNIYKQQTRKNLAELIAMIINGDPAIDFGGIDHKRFSVDRIRTHNDAAWDKKWCPTYMLNDGYVPVLRADVAARVSGVAPSIPTSGLVVGDTVKSTAVLNVRQGAATKWPVRWQLQPGEIAYIKDGPRVEDGYVWFDVANTDKGTGWAAADWLERIDPPKPEPLPTYAPARPVSELAALRKEDADTAAALVVKNGVDFFTVWDEVEAVRDTPLLQFAYKGAKEIGPRAKKGDRRWVSHAFTANDKRGYYYDEHAARLVMADWKRVRD